MAAFTKAAMQNSDVFAVVFWRSAVIIFIALLAARISGESVRPRHWGRLLLRSTLGLAALTCYFWCLGQIPLGVAATLLKTAPLFMVLLAGVVLGVRTRRTTLPLTVVAFGGVALIVWPSDGFDWSDRATMLGLGAGLAAGFLAALTYLTVRKLRETDTASGIVLFFAVFASIATAPLGLRDGLPELWPQGAYLGAVGLFGGLGQLGMTRAYRLEKASIIGPLSYTQIVFSFALGILFFAEEIGAGTLAGVIVVIAAGAFISRQADARAPADP